MLFGSHFAAASVLVAHGEIVVAVLAFERTATGDFDRNLHGHALTGLFLVQVRAELAVTQLFHGPPVCPRSCVHAVAIDINISASATIAFPLAKSNSLPTSKLPREPALDLPTACREEIG